MGLYEVATTWVTTLWRIEPLAEGGSSVHSGGLLVATLKGNDEDERAIHPTAQDSPGNPGAIQFTI